MEFHRPRAGLSVPEAFVPSARARRSAAPGPTGLVAAAWLRVWQRGTPLWLAVSATTLLLVLSARSVAGDDGQWDRWGLLVGAAQSFWVFLPLVPALLAGVPVAQDARRGFVLVRAREVGALKWVAAVTGVASAWSAAVVVAGLGSAAVLLRLTAPALGSEANAVFADADVLPPPAALVVTSTAAAVALCLLAVAVGLWSRSTFVTLAVPLLLPLAVSVALPIDVQQFSPDAVLSLSMGPTVSTTWALGYWLACAVVAALIIVVRTGRSHRVRA